VFALASVPFVILLLNRRTAASSLPVVRVATFNVALNRDRPGALVDELRGGGSGQARRIAEIVQRNAVDVLLLCELDRDAEAAAARIFADEYLGVGQNGQPPIAFEFDFAGAVNTGEPTGLDVDGDGQRGEPEDAHGFGRFPGQYGMALLSRHPIVTDGIRTFQQLRWSAMPQALRPAGTPDAVWAQLRLSSKSHWDVPIHVLGQRIHLLCSHPTPPVFDGPEDRNGCRNHDEIRFWVDYLTPGAGGWIVDDQGRTGGLPEGAHFVLLGDLNCDPEDGDAQRQALRGLLAHPRVLDPAPRSAGGEEQSKVQWGANAVHRGDPALDTGDFEDTPGAGPGNLRTDYVMPSRSLTTAAAGVFWPRAFEPTAALVAASDHRLVWADVGVPAPR
jgi:endonuclease/exonuclease/phosphatase family metal-dependent hydrolase